MNPMNLQSELENFYWYQLRLTARKLGLVQKGNREGLIARIMAHHNDPVCSLEVVRAVGQVERAAIKAGKKRRRVSREQKEVRNLCEQFEEEASDSAAVSAAAVSAAAQQLGAADLSDTDESATPAKAVPRRAAPAVAQISLVTGQPLAEGIPLDSPDLICVPTYLRGWRPTSQ